MCCPLFYCQVFMSPYSRPSYDISAISTNPITYIVTCTRIRAVRFITPHIKIKFPEFYIFLQPPHTHTMTLLINQRRNERANSIHQTNAALMLTHRLRRWASIKPISGQRLVLAGWVNDLNQNNDTERVDLDRDNDS